MDWLLPPWRYLWIGGDSPDPWDGNEGCPGSASSRWSNRTDLDLWLIAVIYEVIATRLTCMRCPAPLRRRTSFVRSAGDGASTASVVTTCAGWRCHRHVATVTEFANDLVFGPFRNV